MPGCAALESFGLPVGVGRWAFQLLETRQRIMVLASSSFSKSRDFRRALRDAAGLRGFRFHDLRHTVVTDLLEAGEPEHVIEAVTGHLSRRMLEQYSHQRLKAKGQMLVRMEERRSKGKAG
jgi:integrase